MEVAGTELAALEGTTQVSTAETTTTKNLLQEIQNTVLEKTYEASRIVGNYIDNAVKNLFDKGVYPARDNSKISDEAYVKFIWRRRLFKTTKKITR